MVRQSRWFVITNWNCNTRESYEKIIEKHQIKFIAYGEEQCPETGRAHHQAYIYFWKEKSTGNRTKNQIGAMFGSVHCYVDPIRGRIADNEGYCSKESQLHKIGIEPTQGVRNDIIETKDEIMGGRLTPDDIFLENPAYGHMYGRTFDRIYNIHLQKQFRKHQTKGIWVYGSSGCGKSTVVFKDFHPEHTFVKDLTVEWWDGYKPLQHKTVVLNDYRGSNMALSDLLTLVDGCPRYVKIRGAQSVPFLAETVIVTSIFTPRECYTDAIDRQGETGEQLDRRFHLINYETSPEMYEEVLKR